MVRDVCVCFWNLDNRIRYISSKTEVWPFEGDALEFFYLCEFIIYQLLCRQ
jgi:hypothetical protein